MLRQTDLTYKELLEEKLPGRAVSSVEGDIRRYIRFNQEKDTPPAHDAIAAYVLKKNAGSGIGRVLEGNSDLLYSFVRYVVFVEGLQKYKRLRALQHGDCIDYEAEEFPDGDACGRYARFMGCQLADRPDKTFAVLYRTVRGELPDDGQR